MKESLCSSEKVSNSGTVSILMSLRLVDLFKRGGICEVKRGIHDWVYYSLARPLIAILLRRRSLKIGDVTATFIIENEESVYRAKGHSERDIMESFIDELRKSDIVWDIGANQGTYTLLTANFGSTVHAFEPGEKARRILNKNLNINDVTATVHAVALGECSEEKILATASRSGSRKITKKGLGDPVPVLRGDDISAPDPNVIKIDVEGHEIAVLRGLNNRLDSTRVIYIELHEGISYKDIKEVVDEYGFDVESIREYNGITKPVRVYRTTP